MTRILFFISLSVTPPEHPKSIVAQSGDFAMYIYAVNFNFLTLNFF
jgi:hypothetical protein